MARLDQYAELEANTERQIKTTRAHLKYKFADMALITIQAGAKAYQFIRENGLAPENIESIFGASGAAKWLAIYGLDKAIFSEWIIHSNKPINLFGTSVGAFKLAAGAQNDPSTALNDLAEAYINQHYEGKVTAAQITIETNRILNAFLSPEQIDQILNNNRLKFHCASVRCIGWLGSTNVSLQKASLLKAFVLALFGRDFHKNMMERTLFQCGEASTRFVGNDGFRTHQVQLNQDNFLSAILSSGSIPVVMDGISNIKGAPMGIHRDGGLLDYHPVPENIIQESHGLVLYPHFYSYLKEGWFDKFAPWRQVSAARLENTIIISPSDEFVAALPGGYIPDRKDFYLFKNNDAERIRRWTIAKDSSEDLGAEFLSLVNSGKIACEVQLMT